MKFGELELESRFTHDGHSFRKTSADNATDTVSNEVVVFDPTVQIDFVLLSKEPDENKLRASIGGNEATGYYCIYRGDRQAVFGMLQKVLRAFEQEPVTEVKQVKANEQGYSS